MNSRASQPPDGCQSNPEALTTTTSAEAAARVRGASEVYHAGIEGFADSQPSTMIDPDGFRPNVGIILLRADNRVFWARRVSHDGWQFPQGGMRSDETPIEAMYRELEEETGLRPWHVDVLGETPGWLRYRLPKRYLRYHEKPLCLGQKQVWFLLRLLGKESHLDLRRAHKPEFDRFRWVDFWYPVRHVVHFKRGVYRRALRHFEQVVAAPESTSQSDRQSAVAK